MSNASEHEFLGKAKPYGTVLIKASSIISTLVKNKTPLTLTAISKKTGLSRSTTLKILDTLGMIGYVRKDKNAKYTLGSELIQLANEYVRNLDIYRVCYPYLKQLHNEFDETVHLGILDNRQVIIIYKLETQKPVVCVNSGPSNRPLYCTAMGKAILADFTPDMLEAYLADTVLVPYTSKTITNPGALRENLVQIARQGYAVDDNEIEQDVYCLGVSISKWNEPAAISISIPTYRMNPELERRIVERLLKLKRQIAIELDK